MFVEAPFRQSSRSCPPRMKTKTDVASLFITFLWIRVNNICVNRLGFTGDCLGLLKVSVR